MGTRGVRGCVGVFWGDFGCNYLGAQTSYWYVFHVGAILTPPNDCKSLSLNKCENHCFIIQEILYHAETLLSC